MALAAYQAQVQRLVHDPQATFFKLPDLTVYINLARRQVARQGQCVRVLLSGGTVTGIANLVGGNGYTAATKVTFTGSGAQAFATPTIVGGVITAIVIVSGGYGYLTAPTVVITDTGGGVGASATAVVDNSASTVVGQEVYKFSTLNTLAILTSGVKGVLGLTSLACQWGAGNTYRPMLSYLVWSEFQAYLRIYANSQVNFPAAWSMYGQGQAGSFYLFPVPSQQMAMDCDAFCQVIDLVDDTTAEAIPDPWTDCVPYYAAYLAFDNAQREKDSARMMTDFNRIMKECRAQTDPVMIPTYYDGGL